jgi:hypothetical protein
MSNMQPLRSANMISMVVISCISYTANKLATRYIFENSEVVSVVGAFVTGILGNLYALKFGGSAFTMMVTGVLFLVPSGLSAASSNEGMTAGSSIALGKFHRHRWDRNHGRIVHERSDRPDVHPERQGQGLEVPADYLAQS